jgi:hypothetical protein
MNKSEKQLVIDKIRSENASLAEVLKNRPGIRRLVEELYPDNAHFIFELLQNAEDTEATEVEFNLTPDSLLFEHNGRRSFTKTDICSITDIGESSKDDYADKIGKFGIGFKAVFAYTESPKIWSRTYSFEIKELVLPTLLDDSDDLNGKTRFEFPFNNPKKPRDTAYKEIEDGFHNLDETTLLFLNHLQSISWKINGSRVGGVRRIHHTKHHIEICKQTDRGTTTSSHFLRFTKSVEGLTKHKIAIAFPLEFLPKVTTFNQDIPLPEQMKIAPVMGQVAVFFPAKKETSGLRFHLHAPFVPEISRASIKEASANKPLFEQLAKLCAASMHDIKKLGLLQRDFLEVLPNSKDDAVDGKYVLIREAIIHAFNEEPLMPTFKGGYSPAKYLFQARNRPLKTILLSQDLEFLIPEKEIPPQWAVNEKRQPAKSDHFMSDLEIQGWDIGKFLGTIAEKANEDSFQKWLSEKPTEWLQQMYALLVDDPNTKRKIYDELKDVRIIRLSDGTFSSGNNCFIDKEQSHPDMPCVDPNVLEAGDDEEQKELVRDFLEKLGVREIGEEELVENILKKKYASEDRPIHKAEDLADLKRFMKFIEENPYKASIFRGYKIFLGTDRKWHNARMIYLDKPYGDTGLKDYYEDVESPDGFSALSGSYHEWGTDNSKLTEFAEKLGAQRLLKIEKTDCRDNLESGQLYTEKWTTRRTEYEIDEDFFILNLDKAVEKESLRISKLIWETLSKKCNSRRFLRAQYCPNASHPSRYADSQLVHDLKTLAWVPQKEGDNIGFVHPAAARLKLLPEGFPFDPGWEWIKAIKFGAETDKTTKSRNEIAAEAGVKPEQLEWFFDMSPEQREQVYEENKPVDFPTHVPKDPKRRAPEVRRKAREAPGRETVKRERSFSPERENVKVQANPYLREHYTIDEEMICQMCEKPMPFKLGDGLHYFEKVEFLPELKRRHYQNYLALCPNHAAMFMYANSTESSMIERVKELAADKAEGDKLKITLAKEEKTIRFTETHISDIKAVIEGDNESDEEQNREE